MGRKALQIAVGALIIAVTALSEYGIARGATDVAPVSTPYNARWGDATIALLVPVLSRSSETGTCKNFDFTRGGEFLVAEAFMHSIERKHHFQLGNGPAGPTLGYLLVDTCYSQLEATGSTVSVGLTLTGARENLTSASSISGMNYQSAVSSSLNSACTHLIETTSPQGYAFRSAVQESVAVVIGPTTDDLVLDVSPLLSAFRVPHIVSPGPGFAANDLIRCDYGNAEGLVDGGNTCSFEYEYFFRMVSSDIHLVSALIDTLERFSWWHVVVLADSSAQGSRSLDLFMQETRRRNLARRSKEICVAFTATIPDSPTEEDRLKDVVQRLRRHERAKVVVLMAPAGPAKVFFDFIVADVKKSEEKIPRVWLATDWGKDYFIFGGKDITEATLTTFIRLWADVPLPFQDFTTELVKDFANHLQMLTYQRVSEEEHNHWLCLNWGAAFNCDGLCTPGLFEDLCFSVGDPSFSSCQAKIPSCNLTDPFTIKVPPEWIYYTSASHSIFAAEVVVRALKDLWTDINRTRTSLTMSERRRLFTRLSQTKLLLSYILRVKLPCGENFTSHCSVFETTDSGLHQALPSYTMMTLDSTDAMVKIGTWSLTESGGNLQLLDSHLDILKWGELSNGTSYPLSDCQLPCQPGAVRQTDDTMCCWTCVPCSGRNYTVDNYTCSPCPSRKEPDQTHSSCIPLPSGTPDFYKTGLAVTGVLATLVSIPVILTIVVLLLKRNTLIVRSADLHLSLILLFGMILALGSVFVLYVPASNGVCRFSRVAVTPWMLLTAATMLVKTLRLVRLWISARKGEVVGSKWTLSTAMQVLLIMAITVLGSLLELGIALSLSSKDLVNEKHEDTFIYNVCNQNLRQLITDILILILVFVSCILAFAMRKMPSTANESNKLFLAAFCISATWVLLTPVYFLSTNYQQTVISLRVIGQVLSLWTWILLPRLYSLKDNVEKVRRRSSNQSIRTIRGGTIKSLGKSTLDSQTSQTSQSRLLSPSYFESSITVPSSGSLSSN